MLALAQKHSQIAAKLLEEIREAVQSADDERAAGGIEFAEEGRGAAARSKWCEEREDDM